MPLQLRSGPWDEVAVTAWLASAVIPVRLASAGRRGPLVQSVWFHYADDALWCATQTDSVLARRIRRDPGVGWEVARDEPPYRGVRGTGRATLIDDSPRVDAVLRSLIGRYGQAGTPLADWLLGRVETEVAVRIDDLRVTSWDYAPRMDPVR